MHSHSLEQWTHDHLFLGPKHAHNERRTWFVVALTAAFVGASDLLGDLHQTPPTWASWARVVMGVALIVFGVARWLTRHRQGKTPFWMRSFSKLTPLRAALTGAVLTALRLEVLILCAVAGLAMYSAKMKSQAERQGEMAGWLGKILR